VKQSEYYAMLDLTQGFTLSVATTEVISFNALKGEAIAGQIR
jgi:hypothetical protein